MIVVDQKLLDATAVALREMLYSARDLNGDRIEVPPKLTEDDLRLAIRIAAMTMIGPPCNGVLGSSEVLLHSGNGKHVQVMP